MVQRIIQSPVQQPGYGIIPDMIIERQHSLIHPQIEPHELTRETHDYLAGSIILRNAHDINLRILRGLDQKNRGEWRVAKKTFLSTEKVTRFKEENLVNDIIQNNGKYIL